MKGKLLMHQGSKEQRYFLKKGYNMEIEFNWKNYMNGYHWKRFCW